MVVLRAGPIAVDKVVEHALREARAYSFGGKPLYSVSVSLAVDGWTVDDLLAGPLASRTTYAADFRSSPLSITDIPQVWSGVVSLV